jgi:hypothetical protein
MKKLLLMFLVPGLRALALCCDRDDDEAVNGLRLCEYRFKRYGIPNAG